MRGQTKRNIHQGNKGQGKRATMRETGVGMSLVSTKQLTAAVKPREEARPSEIQIESVIM